LKAVRIGRLARTGRLTRLARRLWMSKNPLRRRADRIEAWITAGLIALFLAAAPISCLAVGRWVQHGGLREQRAQQSWHQIPAVLVRSAPSLPHFDFRTSWSTEVQVLARWMTPRGLRTGVVPAAPGSWAGRTVPVWVDPVGRPTGTPLLNAELTRRVVGAEVLAPVVLAALLFTLGRTVRWAMDRRRLAGWEANWAFVGPRWTRHH
jgi:hypothetical protein